eukprot:scaffold3847_cov34-Tisochrysis_lutea.AAC.1
MTKEFFRRFHAKTSNQAIPELCTTDDWENPGGSDRSTTRHDHEIRNQLRKYYVWLYQERETTRDSELEEALKTQPLADGDAHAA